MGHMYNKNVDSILPFFDPALPPPPSFCPPSYAMVPITNFLHNLTMLKEKNQNDQTDFRYRKLTLKIRFW